MSEPHPPFITFAGAGVSASPPTCLPGWWVLNEMIMKVLSDRLHTALGWNHGKISAWIDEALARRNDGQFPPEYQAQLIEEMCGLRYFRALQSLDVGTMNGAHRSIAALAVSGRLHAVVTTNFDRLIELALDERGVAYRPVLDEGGYEQLAARLERGESGPLVVMKIHGCVSDPCSMIDTLKQRLRGRSNLLERCLDGLGCAHWLYLGFSADDLCSNPDYLGMRARAQRSLGGTYLKHPSNSAIQRGAKVNPDTLSAGARLLMEAHGHLGECVVDEIEPFLAPLIGSLGGFAFEMRGNKTTGTVECAAKLTQWASELSPAAAGLCLAAIFEAVGNAEGAARLLDKLVRKQFVTQADRDSEDYRAAQLHYGRLGAAWGRFHGVPDVNGMESNASVETAQSLMRLQHSTLDYSARTWMLCHQLWLGRGDEAMRLATQKLAGLAGGFPPDEAPRNEEEAIDAWIAVAQAFLIDEGRQSSHRILSKTPLMVSKALACGDAVRAARVAALGMLASSRRKDDVRDEFNGQEAIFGQAERVFDGFALGMRHLALGRWLVGAGGIALSKTLGQVSVANGALRSLGEAVKFFSQQGMDPWVLYATIQIIKACGDLHDFDAAQSHANDAATLLERFPIFEAHLREAQFQLLAMGGVRHAMPALEKAIEAAASSGLQNYCEMLQSTLHKLNSLSEGSSG